MLNDILYLTTILATRIAFPIVITLTLGILLERTLRRDANGTAA
jgi:hypothetical protein